MDRRPLARVAKEVRGRRRRETYSPLEPATQLEQRCFEAKDSTVTPLSARFLLRGQPSRDPSSQIARLADQFIGLNRAALRQLDLVVEPRYRNSTIELDIHAGTRIGAIPLISPTSGRHDYGLVVRPRFDWPGIGPILGATGWRVIPAPLSMPLLPPVRAPRAALGAFDDHPFSAEEAPRPVGASVRDRLRRTLITTRHD